MSDHEEWKLAEEALRTDMFLTSILIVDLSVGIRDIANKVVDLLVHAELVSQPEHWYFVVILKYREECLLGTCF